MQQNPAWNDQARHNNNLQDTQASLDELRQV
jgi:hypothetical protein